MVFLEESFAARWLPFFAAAWPGRKSAKSGSRESSVEGRDSLATADCLEKGLAHEFAEDHLRPAPRSTRPQRFHVERSANRLEYRLFRDGGDFVMYAEVRQESREIYFFLYDPDDSENTLYDPERPAFVMTFDQARREWLLSHHGDEADGWYSPGNEDAKRRRETREVALVQHSKFEVGHGVNHCMEVDIAMTGSEARNGGQQEVRRLVTKQAVWNEELQSLVLDFRGRQVIPSAKNFQLVEEGRKGRVVCQHGKISRNTFALDFMYPMSISQAFAASVTTLFWE